MQKISLVAIVLIFLSGCLGYFGQSETCNDLATIVHDNLDEGYLLVRSSGDEKLGSCVYTKVKKETTTSLSKSQELILVYFNTPSFEGKTQEETKEFITSLDMYRDSEVKSEVVREDGSFYFYLEGKERGLEEQDIFFKDRVLVQISVISGTIDDFYSEEELLLFAKKMQEYFSS